MKKMIFRNKDGSRIDNSVDRWIAAFDGRIKLEESIPSIEDIIKLIKTCENDEILGKKVRENFKNYFSKQK